MPPTIDIRYDTLQPTRTIDHLLDAQNYDTRRRGNLIRRAKITMNRFINDMISVQPAPTTPLHQPTMYLTVFEVRGQPQILASVIRFDHVTDNMRVILTGDLYIAPPDEKDQLIQYIQTLKG